MPLFSSVGQLSTVVGTPVDTAAAIGTSSSVARADHVHNLADSVVATAKIADLNVTTGKLADGAATTLKIADLNVTPAKLSAALHAKLVLGVY